jgi:uncharacterized protein (UPF0332 family)
MEIETLIEMGMLSRIPPDAGLAEKERAECKTDLKEAKKELEGDGHKWAIIKAYYSMFHAAKAVLFLLGLKERSHYGVGEALHSLSEDGKLESSYVDDFKGAVSERVGADYHYRHSASTAKEMVDVAAQFAKRMEELAGKISDRKKIKGGKEK